MSISSVMWTPLVFFGLFHDVSSSFCLLVLWKKYTYTHLYLKWCKIETIFNYYLVAVIIMMENVDENIQNKFWPRNPSSVLIYRMLKSCFSGMQLIYPSVFPTMVFSVILPYLLHYLIYCTCPCFFTFLNYEYSRVFLFCTCWSILSISWTE